ncbi:UDP-3-O-(3-hydroxymyristoyl)glucosamine N-acyltransferase [Bryobacter aggregatus]|uniref:UDP-3-O-(3-hydroxymyristoyl)glucosamine N-acyltransferase n=1 Tax=Bryobacter aggregatus TaxID=360054 RepID=UPI0004E131BD|nr:UDP-3-O-(3-hydroxymyristoyl)glucosamine N-acyltransferase [Bryobacter aggregatus]
MRLSEIAAQLGCRVAGESDPEIHSLSGMEQAAVGQLTFLANPKYAHKVKDTQASAIIAAQPSALLPTLLSSNPYLDFARALELFYQAPQPAPGISPLAHIAASAEIGEGARIGPFCSVGEKVKIGKNAILHPHVVIYEGASIGDDFLAHSHAVVREFCRVGHRVILQNHVVIGGDGFGFAKGADGTHHKIVQSGVTVLEDDVEIQALSNIDRATMGETRIKRGAKVDSLVQVGHACVVGEDNILCAQVGLAGSTILKKSVLLAGQVGVSGHLTIHDNAVVYAQSGIGHDVPQDTIVSGSPAFDYREWRRAVTAFPKLGEMVRHLRDLETRLKALEEGKSTNG